MYSTKLIYSNPFITEAMAEKISAKVFGLQYMPCNVKFRGNPAHQAGDALRVVDRSGNKHTVLIMSQTINFGGGLNTQISCPGETEEDAAEAVTTPTGQKIQTVYGQVSAEYKLYADELAKKTLEAAKTYTDEQIAQNITDALGGSY